LAAAAALSWRRGLPGLVLLALLGGVYYSVVVDGKMEVQTRADSKSYLKQSELPWMDQLRAERTVGYPLLLRLTRRMSPQRQVMPHLHYLVFLGGVFALWGGLRKLGVAPWMALAAVAPLPFSELLNKFGAMLITDTLSAGLALLTLAALCRVAARPRRKAAWWLLCVALAATYQVRPAYLFMILLVPLLGSVLYLRHRSSESGLPVARWLVRIVAVSVLPFVLFSTYRWVAVEQWGLVSFGGYNVVGIAGSLLSEEVVERVDPEYQELARSLLAARTERSAQLGDKRFQPLQERRFRSARRKMDTWYEEYNVNIWDMGVGLAQSQAEQRGLRFKEQVPFINHQLAGLSKDVFGQLPGEYLGWIAQGMRIGVSRSVRWVRSLDLCLGLALLGILALALARAVAVPRPPKAFPATAVTDLDAIWLIAGSFFLASLLLIVLVEPPLPRYLHAAGMLLPGAALALASETLAAAARLLGASVRQLAAHKANSGSK